MPRSSKAIASSSSTGPSSVAIHAYRTLGTGRKADSSSSDKVFWEGFQRSPSDKDDEKRSYLANSDATFPIDSVEGTFQIGSVVIVKHTTPLPLIGLITQIFTVEDDDDVDKSRGGHGVGGDVEDDAGVADDDDDEEDFVPLWCKIRFLYWPEELTRATQTRIKGLIAENEIFYTHRLPRFVPGSRKTNRSQAAAESFASDNFAEGHSLLESDAFTVSEILGHAFVNDDTDHATPRTVTHKGRVINCNLFCCKAVDPMKELFWTIDYPSVRQQGLEGKGWDLRVAEDDFAGKALTQWADEERKRAKKEGRTIAGGDDPISKKTQARRAKPRKPSSSDDSDSEDDGHHDKRRGKKHLAKGKRKGKGATAKKAAVDGDYNDQASSSSESDFDSDSSFDSDTDEDEDEDDDLEEYENYGSDDDYGGVRKRKRGGAGLSQPSTPRKRRTTTAALAKPTPRSRRIIDLRREARTQMQDRSTNAASGAFLPNPTSSLPFDFVSQEELDRMTPHQRAKRLLHVSTTPSTLPCRSAQAENLLCLLEDSLDSGLGSCIYISGVPGTGKTATVRGVIAQLQARSASGQVNPFDFLEINGMKVADAAEAYSMLWSVVGDRGGGSGSTRRRSPKAALNLLSKHYSSSQKTGGSGMGRAATIVLMDELDQLLTSRQDVMYNLFNWPSSRNSRLIVVAVANTMDLPERTLNPKVASRLGMTRITFMPYTDRELGEIVRVRLGMGGEGKQLKEEAKRVVDNAHAGDGAASTVAVTNGETAHDDAKTPVKADASLAIIDADASPQRSPSTVSRHKLFLSAISECDGIFVDDAITYAAKRISNVSGDARRMLDVCRRAVEMKEGKLEVAAEPAAADTAAPTPAPTPRITIHDIRLILDGMVKSARPSHISRSLSVHSKVLLISLLHLTRKTGLQEVKLEELETRWRGSCRMHSISVTTTAAAKMAELSLHPALLVSIDTLIHLGLVIPVGAGVGPGKARGWERIMLAQGLREDEVRLALEGDADARVRGML